MAYKTVLKNCHPKASRGFLKTNDNINYCNKNNYNNVGYQLLIVHWAMPVRIHKIPLTHHNFTEQCNYPLTTDKETWTLGSLNNFLESIHLFS